MAYEFRIPQPYPGAGTPRLFLERGDLIVSFDPLAQDEAPKYPAAALPSARGGEGASRATDQDPDDNGTTIANSPQHAAFLQLSKFLDDRLSPDDLADALQLIQQLLGGDDDSNGNGGGPALGTGSAMAGDRHPERQSYAQRFPDADRLGRSRYRTAG